MNESILDTYYWLVVSEIEVKMKKEVILYLSMFVQNEKGRVYSYIHMILGCLMDIILYLVV